MKYFLSFIAIILLLSPAFQALAGNPPEGTNKADKRFFKATLKLIDKGHFRHAEANFLELIKRDPQNIEYNYELAMLYFYDLKRSDKALPYFEKVKELVSSSEDFPELHYYLGQVLHFTGAYDSALTEYSQCDEMELTKRDELAGQIDRDIAACRYAKEQRIHTDIRVRNVGNRINSGFPEYVPVSLKNDSMLLFTAKRPPVISTHYGFEGSEYFEKIYISNKNDKNFSFAEATDRFPAFKLLQRSIRKHNAVIGISQDERQLLIYRKNKIWTSDLVGGVWQKPVKIQKSVNFSFYQPHVSMTQDGKMLFFSSLNKKGFGELDIYYSEKDKNGKWSKAKNLGEVINTKYGEDSPEISPDGKTLYFSSQGHPGMGGYDIFRSDFVNGQWSRPINMGNPVNSPGDDIFFRFSKNRNLAYFSSYRENGIGNMDIYEAEFFPAFERCNKTDSSRILANHFMGINCTDSIFAGKQVTFNSVSKQYGYGLYDLMWKIDTIIPNDCDSLNYTFDNVGNYEIMLEANVMNNETNYTETFCISKKLNVIKAQELIAVVNTDSVIAAYVSKDTVIAVVPKDSNIVAVVTESKVLESVYFDFDSYALRVDARAALDKNIEILLADKSLKISIAAHTDSRGSAQYNKILSQRRAATVYNYLASKIDKSRIVESLGKGEDEQLEQSGASAKTLYQLNRRCDIKAEK